MGFRKTDFHLTKINRNHPHTNGLISLWTFPERGALKSYDISNFATTATPRQGAGAWNAPTHIAGKHGLALNFSGSDRHLKVDDSAITFPRWDTTFFNGSFTIASWVNVSAVGTPHSQIFGNVFNAAGIIPDSDAGTGLCLINDASDIDILFIGQPNGNNSHTKVQGSAIAKDVWTHLACTFIDGVGVRLYINGQLDTTSAAITDMTSDPSDKGAYIFGMQQTNDDFITDYPSITGYCESVWFYNRALSHEQIRSLYTKPYDAFVLRDQPAIWLSLGLGGVTHNIFATGGVVVRDTAIVGPNIEVPLGLFDHELNSNALFNYHLVNEGWFDEEFVDELTSTAIYNVTATGGIVCAGTATFADNEITTGGVVCAGTATFTDNVIATGGIAIIDDESETAIIQYVANIDATGGIVLSGTARRDTVTVGLRDTNDDGFESQTGSVTLTSLSENSSHTNSWLAFRFQDVPTEGQLIADARLTIYADTGNKDDPNHEIYFHASDNSPALEETDNYFSNLPRTNSVNWTSSDLGAPAFVTSPDISDILQEVIDRPGWVANNAVTILINSNGGAADLSVSFLDAGFRASLFIDYAMITNPLTRGGVVCAGEAEVNSSEQIVAEGGIVCAGEAEVNSSEQRVAEGGIVCAGISTFKAEEIVTGGVVCAGETEINSSEQIVSEGGIVCAGEADVVTHVSEIATGGIVCAGEADVVTHVSEIATGGVICVGEAKVDSSEQIVAEGGVVCAGEAEVNSSEQIVTTGGIICAGEAEVATYVGEIATGGIICAGEAEVATHVSEIATGGVVCAGETEINSSEQIVSEGGIVCAGEAEAATHVGEIATGGIVCAGEAEAATHVSEIATGGVVVAGEAAFQAEEIATGGIVCAGETETILRIKETASGGVDCSGTADVRCVYNINVTGGVIVAGVANQKVINQINGSGGVVVGSATFSHTSIGGIVIGGSSNSVFGFKHTSTRGVSINGNANYSLKTFVAKGIVVGGAAEVNRRTLAYTSSGGVLVEGKSLLRTGFKYNPVRGVRINGDSAEFETNKSNGGLLCGGTAEINRNYYSYISTGEVIIGGNSDLELGVSYNPVGRVIIGGSAIITKSFYQYTSTGGLKITGMSDYVFSVGDFSCPANTLSCVVKFPNPHIECPEILFFWGECEVLDPSVCDISGALLSPIIACRQRFILPPEDRTPRIPKN